MCFGRHYYLVSQACFIGFFEGSFGNNAYLAF
jgi:hypothetical protein